DNGIAARITENGFVYAFHCNDEEKARTHMEELLRRLNISTEEENKSRNPMFHAAVYRLTPEDTSCELLLFNLRRNCTKTIGTETKLTFLSDKDMNRASEEKKLIDAFRDGFANQEFKLYLQFIVENETKQIISAEALSRWEHPERGLLAPGAYISAMESTGEITNLDYYMFETVCRRLHKWKDTEFGNISISCNFTRITLSEENFARRLEEIASGYVFNRSKLIIEITEDVIEQDRDRATDNVRACKKMGFRVALDDLGSGYTSLSNLCDYPIDIVKIDRDIMLKTNRKNGKELFSGIIALAHSMNLKVVCEGVETEQHNAFVSASDCDYVQGWYYSRVHPATEAESFIRTYRENLK
ncbi:MAG: EAL domain-containing protein, partial [Clostridia bacterium]|nr:EAL domain-containing protein [Clostridia bacterium]